ncbi:MAG: hypothetical protein ACJ74O_07615 [Frankiaceae bacterium]
MALLRCAGAFAVPVPDGWEVRGIPGRDYLLTPAGAPSGGRRGELRLAVFPREPGPLAEREGADRLLELLRELAVDAGDEAISFRARYRRDLHRAFAWFSAHDELGHDLDCLAAVVVVPSAVIACTALASPRRRDILETSEMVVSSITADRPRH